jgi:tRNA-Thr(GGU) m(6)t(6)A37 methyltransferase TsaA
MTGTFQLAVIGHVESPLTTLDAAPRQPDEGAPAAWLVFNDDVADSLVGIRPGDDILVFTWLDRAKRDVLQVHPRGDTARAVEGVFNTRSPHRPNPIGLHRTKVTEIEGLRVHVEALEAVDGTPLLDVKPVLDSNIETR